MSSKPSVEGVSEFKRLWGLMSESADTVSRLQDEIEHKKKQLAEAADTYTDARRDLFKLMSDMDVQSNGNWGYEGRMSWFLVELHRQLASGFKED